MTANARNPLSTLKSHLGAACAAAALLVAAGGAEAADLNALIWCDHSDPALLQPFEEANNVKVNVKEFEGTGAGLAIVEQSQPGDWEIDSIDVPRGVEKGLFEPLPEDKLPFADLFAEVKMDKSTIVDGKRYGITEKFGYNTIGFNKTKVDPADMQSLASLTGDKYKGKIAIYDYYLPVIGMAALAIGKKTADLTEADLPALKAELLKMKANAKLVGEVTASQTALATGEVDILVGGGEWVTAGLAKENPALDFSIPKEGAVLWSQSLAMFKDSKNKDMALKFIRYIMSPEGQARLATSSCYWGMPANTKAALTDEQKKTLRFDEQPGFLARAQAYPAPNADLDKKMQDMWTEMLQAQ
ncbi:MAG: spermidine/putrescine ABC transporter substrate-binding protein [Mesorhizobium sp.]|uniref:polyamine ABC transporter substrate-binding protein n=1 Tax=Mesorhizobium sp. TaxID=1871066 RepID=UPI0012026E61|nr:spermidine/putrescine ABC transporter substrate-binding protein [Mesorhizobium sp.]TIO51448.1 MAG: spermidine/putrescine ABC transporter substrate-binding protein [Mesorhizobium sp.]TIO59666.1 MAG: spermidine/putrescine ABC transporter substrate-binding protein [Mesorhizobium sp.]TJV64894.1 MAG: spermidine/putrescine ABC transporter substrate-binding protein [Mesorhizobium sp.]